MSGWMELKHPIQLKQHQAQVKVFALIFILFYVSTQIFGLLISLHHLWYHTLSTSTYKKIFLKPGTSTDTSGDIPNVRPDATETPDSPETTSSPGQSVCFGFHSVSCGKLSTQVLGLLINVLGSQKSQQMCRISKQSFPLSDLNSIQTGGGSQKSILIALSAEHWINLCAFRTMNIALFTCQRF